MDFPESIYDDETKNYMSLYWEYIEYLSSKIEHQVDNIPSDINISALESYCKSIRNSRLRHKYGLIIAQYEECMKGLFRLHQLGEMKIKIQNPCYFTTGVFPDEKE